MIGLGVLLAACGGGTGIPATGATPTPVATPTPAATPTPVPTEQPTATPAPTPIPPTPTATPAPAALPAILVESPTAGQTVHSPLRIWGTSNTFEAVFRIRLTTADGRQLFDYQVKATSGTGTRGSFDVTVRFTASGPATLQAYEVSMKDGSHINVVNIPLTLQP